MIIIEPGHCKGCGICVQFCPKHILEMSDALNSLGYRLPRVIDVSRCNRCRQCELYCPDLSIFITEDGNGADG